MLTLVKFCFIFIICFAEALIINNYTLKAENKVNKVCLTAITVLLAVFFIAIVYNVGVNLTEFTQ